MKKIYSVVIWIACAAAAACRQPISSKPAATAAGNKPPAIMQPFRYHKIIEVAPGQDYDVFSWGRGPAATAAYLILHSDSTGKKYTTTTGDVDGKIVDVFNTDLDTDGNPEIFVQSQTADSTGYDKVEVYEYNQDNVRKLDFPKLTSRQKRGYHGGDDFTVKNNQLLRTYTIYDGDNAAAKPTAEKRTLAYSFHNNDFSVKQLSTDSTSAKTSADIQAQPAETAPADKNAANRQSGHHTRHHEARQHEHKHKQESRRRESKRKHGTEHHHETGRRRRHH